MMTEQNGQRPVPTTPVDTGNQLLTERPIQLHVTPANTPGGSRLIVTIRTETTTLTGLLTKDIAQDWAATLNAGCANMSGIILPGQ